MLTVFMDILSEARRLPITLRLDEGRGLSSLLTEITMLHRPKNVPSGPRASECSDFRRNFQIIGLDAR